MLTRKNFHEAEATYVEDLGGDFTSDKYVAACAICHTGYVLGYAKDMRGGPLAAHLSCMEKKAKETTHG